MTSSYASLGIRPIINAHATLTKLGGSLMPPEVVQAMNDAASCFVDMHELQRKVGERIAELTRNEAAYVSSGAAAGLLLATAACVVGCDPEGRESFPHLDGLKNEIVVQKLHRNGYDYAVREVGVSLIEIGDEQSTSSKDLENAVSERTAAVFWFQGAMNRPTELALADVIAIANERDIPVVVDAAAQLPPASNLWKFTKMGAALAIFSGGKDLSGPQSSGLVLGRKDLIEAIRLHGAPNHAVGRPMKVGKEEIMGLLAAVERYLALNHEVRGLQFEATVKMWNEALNELDGVSATRDYPNEAGQPAPRTLVTFVGRVDRDDIIGRLWEGDPVIAVAPSEEGNGILLNPMTLQVGEAEVVMKRLVDILS